MEPPSTPPRTEHLQSSVQDTPSGQWPTSPPLFESGKLEHRKELLGAKLGKTLPEKTQAHWLSDILPPTKLTRDDINGVYKRLVQDGIYCPVSKTWRELRKPPKTDPRHETKVYQPLVPIFSAILDAVPPALAPQKLIYKQKPYTPPTDERPDDRTKPDANFVRITSSTANATSIDKISWINIREIQEFKKDGTRADLEEACLLPLSDL
ncbi:hypothetical protein DACRYDRAFT_111401 [Dacryopinax primogenitus]|uniref:Uncharacterized protein n=1 Tax=Dacryopinax primogenitus (strain DJM 731) TaxID=1858805 RepID=M5G290_DACPD|nr:uncharacterized protein DACRYDRAFT_111401 [Dacryopinax primogenitus]EJT97882.1 hypothetical protein DACRYDRAFT_111401 [Dacryopinax primogenitus]